MSRKHKKFMYKDDINLDEKDEDVNEIKHETLQDKDLKKIEQVSLLYYRIFDYINGHQLNICDFMDRRLFIDYTDYILSPD